jgi:ABC-type transport system involved in cytochrome bd biosynthesis fused ATPase/permease subunit
MTSGAAMSVAQASITLLGVDLVEGGRVVVSGMSQQFLPQQLSVIVGPPKSGQLSLLRQIAGREPSHKGSVVIGALPLDELDPADYQQQVTFFCEPPLLAQLQLCRAPIVLLADPTAGLGPQSARSVIDALVELAKERTVICSTGEPALIAAADHVVSLD